MLGSAANMALVLLNTRVLYPMPEGLDMSDTEAFGAWIGTLPPQAWAVVVIAHLAQAFVGGWVAARLSRSRPLVAALVVGALSLAGGVANAMTLPVPPWLWAEMPLYLVAAWGGAKLVRPHQ